MFVFQFFFVRGYDFFLCLHTCKRPYSLSTLATRIVNFRTASGAIFLVRYADISPPEEPKKMGDSAGYPPKEPNKIV